jgi:protein-S-isoprenylcysteine O-methyltransferase Ste14
MLHVMSGAGPPVPGPDAPEARRRKAAGAWAGSLIFALCLLFLIVFDAQAVYQHQWASVTGITVFILLFLFVPTGGARWLRRTLRDRKPPGQPGG